MKLKTTFSGIVLLLIICIFYPLYANDRFGQQIIIQQSELSSPTSIAVCDLDTDGDGDVLVSSWSDNKITWFENTDAKGTFKQQQAISDSVTHADYANYMDVDGDADLDVLSLAQEGGKLAWHENLDNKGSFGTKHVIADSIIHVIACDLDNDGDQDIVTLRNNTQLLWFENETNNSRFNRAITIRDSLIYAFQVSIADLDGDGDDDIMVSKNQGTDTAWEWYENKNNATQFIYHHVPTAILNQKDIYQYRICTSDIDNDGDTDIVLAAFYYEGQKLPEDFGLSWFENIDGKGAFSAPHIISDYEADIISIYSTDIDGDGDQDFVTSCEWGMIAWWENIAGVFKHHVINDKSTSGRFVTAYDLDNDGDQDVLAATLLDDKIAWYENLDGTGQFSRAKPVNITLSQVQSVYPADLDGDGDLDVLSGSAWVAWNENLDGKGNFRKQRVIYDQSPAEVQVLAADLDGDKALDVVSASIGDNLLAWYHNEDGKGAFSGPHVISTTVNGPPTIFTIDVDSDGDMDVLTASRYSNFILWYANDGEGNFSEPQLVSGLVDAPACVFAADLDNDGDPDVLSASLYDNKIAWYENLNGKGIFGAQKIISIERSFARAVSAADIDKDGDLDVLSASWWDYTIAWYENMDGAGTFGPGRILSSVEEWASSVTAADVDLDGDMDVLFAAQAENMIGWFENLDGKGNFGERQVITQNAEGAHMVVTADLDNDGDPDVLTSSILDNKVAWHKNLSISTGISSGSAACKQFVLNQNYPNPFNSATIINYNLPIRSHVKCVVYNIQGQQVALLINEMQEAGAHHVIFDATTLQSGIYLYKITADDFTDNGKMLFLK
ncbi:MAG TPA: T9SS type A sorting domain-containing protein [bacterium]|nr:T9SS type A sorting domain-containing protein [bacterium]HPN45647.1 T9SS type A sorting domain-containing protein [bacterium]